MELEFLIGLMDTGIPSFVVILLFIWRNMSHTIPRIVTEHKEAVKAIMEEHRRESDHAIASLQRHQTSCSVLHNASREQVGRLISRIPKAPGVPNNVNGGD